MATRYDPDTQELLAAAAGDTRARGRLLERHRFFSRAAKPD
jgi:hypothetical protein